MELARDIRDIHLQNNNSEGQISRNDHTVVQETGDQTMSFGEKLESDYSNVPVINEFLSPFKQAKAYLRYNYESSAEHSSAQNPMNLVSPEVVKDNNQAKMELEEPQPESGDELISSSHVIQDKLDQQQHELAPIEAVEHSHESVKQLNQHLG